jgi:hypothetical protein
VEVSEYVLGIVSPNSTCIFDSNPAAATDLDSLAQAGGTDHAYLDYTTGFGGPGDASLIRVAFESIQSATASCP